MPGAVKSRVQVSGAEPTVVALSLGERVDRDGALISRRGPGEGSVTSVSGSAPGVAGKFKLGTPDTWHPTSTSWFPSTSCAQHPKPLERE